MAWMNHGGFIIPLPEIFNGMTPSTQNDCVPVTVGVGVGVPVRVRVTVSVHEVNTAGVPIQPVSQPVLQVSAQPVQVWLAAPVGVSNPMQQRFQANEVQVGEIVPTGSTLQQFAVNFGAVGVTTLAVAAESGKLQAAQAIAQMAREIAVFNAATADAISDGKDAFNFVMRIRASGINAELLRQGFVKAGMSFSDASKVFEKFFNDKALIQYVDDVIKTNPQVFQQAQQTILQATNRTLSVVCAV